VSGFAVDCDAALFAAFFKRTPRQNTLAVKLRSRLLCRPQRLRHALGVARRVRLHGGRRPLRRSGRVVARAQVWPSTCVDVPFNGSSSALDVRRGRRAGVRPRVPVRGAHGAVAFTFEMVPKRPSLDRRRPRAGVAAVPRHLRPSLFQPAAPLPLGRRRAARRAPDGRDAVPFVAIGGAL